MRIRFITAGLIFISLQLTSFEVEARPAFCNLPDNHAKLYIMYFDWKKYGAPCPCPYNVDSLGNRCGWRSAYTRTGGAHPICDPNQISAQMVREFKRRHCSTY